MAKPLDARVRCVVEPYCDYPVAVRIAMDDGTVQTYSLDNKMDLKFEHLMKLVKRSVEIGYMYRPAKRRNRIHRSQL